MVSIIAFIAFGAAFVAAWRTNGCFGMKDVPELMEFTISGIGTCFPASSAYPAFRKPTLVSTSVPFLLNFAIPAAACLTISFSSGDGSLIPFMVYWNGVILLLGRIKGNTSGSVVNNG